MNGKARGLAAAEGRLIVSTDTGEILCFKTNGKGSATIVKQETSASPWPEDELTSLYKKAAQEILAKSSANKGFAVVLDCASGRLAYELARQSKLKVYGLAADEQKAAIARKKLQQAGYLGTRVRIDAFNSQNAEQLPYPEYFANLVTSENIVNGGVTAARASELFRMTRPLGGTIYIGNRDKSPEILSALQQWKMGSQEMEGAEITTDSEGCWLTFKRGAIPGAGSWTQEYAEPGNTTCGNDSHLKCPLSVLWYGNPGPAEMAERHTRASAPLSTNGRMFIQGEGKGKKVGTTDNVIMCYDAYNGVKHWERRLPGALRMTMSHDGANAVASEDSYFIITRNGCQRLSAETGETLRTYQLPDAAGDARNWGYISVVDKRLYGTWTKSRRTGSGIFCMDVESGNLLWTYAAERIPQGAISIGGGKVFLSQANVTKEQRREALNSHYESANKLKGEELESAMAEIEKADVQLISSLNADSGKVLWTKPMELTGAIGHDYWCSLGSIYKNNTLVLFGVYADGHYWKQFFAGKFETRRVFALNADDGKSLWKKNIGYRVRPIVVGNQLHAEPWAYDLRTGSQIMREHPITGIREPWQFARPGHHCGCPAASENMLLFRSLTLGWYDLLEDFGTQHFGSLRTSCWINFIPANGVLMVPEGGSGCMCAFPTSCTVVFKNSDENRSWAYFSSPGEISPVKHLALNLGAPGDRRAEDGTLWLGYPRPRGSLVMDFQAESKYYGGGGLVLPRPTNTENGWKPKSMDTQVWSARSKRALNPPCRRRRRLSNLHCQAHICRYRQIFCRSAVV